MSLIKIFENDNFIIDYDKEEKQYRASYFVNNHWVDECWFNPYEEELDAFVCKLTDEDIKEISKLLKISK